MKVDREIRDADSGMSPDAGFSTRPAVKADQKAHPIRFAAAVATLVALVASSSLAQQSHSNQATPREPVGAIEDRLKAEAARIEKAEVSPLFTALPRLAGDPAFRLQEGQIQLCRKSQALARDIVRAWLLRGLDRKSSPEAGKLEARLSNRGVKLREGIFSHVEEMALRGILTPEQSRLWLTRSGAKPRRPLRGRVEVQIPNIPPDSQTSADLARDLKSQAKGLPRSGEVFVVILGRLWIDEEYPDGVDKIDPKVKESFLDGDLPAVVLDPDQTGLARRLDELARNIIATWMVRGLDDKPAPSRPALVERIMRKPLFADTLCAHAEAIALEGILKPDQSDRCLAIVWNGLGVRSLLDSSLSTRLKLTRSQREEIKSRIENKEESAREIDEAFTPFQLHRFDTAETAAKAEEFSQEVHRQAKAADAAIFDLLTPSQSRRLKQLIAPGVDTKSKREDKK